MARSRVIELYFNADDDEVVDNIVMLLEIMLPYMVDCVVVDRAID